MTYDPSLRVLTVLELLQAHEEVKGAELARKLEVSPRTVQRYIMRLQDLGIPVQGKRGVGGAYRLKPGFRLPPMMCTGEEALALVLGLRALTVLGLQTLTPAAEAASAKLTRTLPHDLQQAVQALEDAVQLEASPWVVRTDAAVLAALLRAVRASCAAEFTYTASRGASTRRRVNVYRVLHLEGRWYAVGWCQLRRSLRFFRLDRIKELVVLNETFTAPADFDAVAYVRASLHESPPPEYDVSVWLACPPEDLQGHLSVWNTEMTAEHGGTRVKCKRDQLNFFASFLLGVPCEFRVESPPELLVAIRGICDRCAAVLGKATLGSHT